MDVWRRFVTRVAHAVLLAQLFEGPAEPRLAKEAQRTSWLAFCQKWGWRKVPGHRFWLSEVIKVVALAPAHGDCEREGPLSSPRPSDTLLIVEPLRGHVGLEDRPERSYVDANFHCRRDSQQIDLLRRYGQGVVECLVDNDAFEFALAIGGLVRLSRKLFAAESMGLSRTLDSFREKA